MVKFSRLISILSLIVLSAWQAQAENKAIYPKTGLPAHAAFAELLKDALAKSGHVYSVESSLPSLTEARYLAEVKIGQMVNVIWTSATQEKEDDPDMIPVRIPIEKGILGYRISFTSTKNQEKIRKINNLPEFKKLTIGQGIGWGDVKLYQENGFNVTVAPFENLFEMTAASRFEIFPRGIGEVAAEVAEFTPKAPGLVVDDHLLIYYPWPYYFFVSKKYPQIAADLEKGLEVMVKDGSFEKHFNKHYSESIKAANLKGRFMIKLKNPFMPKSIPLKRKELWYSI